MAMVQLEVVMGWAKKSGTLRDLVTSTVEHPLSDQRNLSVQEAITSQNRSVFYYLHPAILFKVNLRKKNT